MALSDVGVKAGSRVAHKKAFWEEYDALSPDLAKEVEAYERLPRHIASGSLAQEEYHRLREDNISARKRYRMEMQDELKKARTGRILHMNHFLLLLKSAGLKAWYTDTGARPGMLGLFVSANGMAASYVCFVQVPYMQEFEEVYFDDYDVPLGPKRRGWRTVLLRLIQGGHLTEEQAHAVFGEPVTGSVSRRYLAELQRLRNSNTKKENANGAG